MWLQIRLVRTTVWDCLHWGKFLNNSDGYLEDGLFLTFISSPYSIDTLLHSAHGSWISPIPHSTCTVHQDFAEVRSFIFCRAIRETSLKNKVHEVRSSSGLSNFLWAIYWLCSWPGDKEHVFKGAGFPDGRLKQITSIGSGICMEAEREKYLLKHSMAV